MGQTLLNRNDRATKSLMPRLSEIREREFSLTVGVSHESRPQSGIFEGLLFAGIAVFIYWR
jgi:hypothetical protein